MNKDGHVLNAILLSLGLGVILSLNPMRAITTADAVPTLGSIAALSIPVVLGALFPDVDTAFGRHRKTLHNLPVLAIFLVWPYYFGNLHFVWIGVATHYVLDVVGSRRGIALFYPLSDQEYGLPTGVATSSDYAAHVTVAVTVLELSLLAVVHYYVFALDAGLPQAVQAVQALGL
ncbi:MAG: metal-dependent hydrolase [Salinigranum sp.]